MGSRGFVNAGGDPVTPDTENGRDKLLLTVDPAKGLSLADVEAYGVKVELPEVNGEKSLVNGEDANLYAIRLAAVWGDMPTYFTYNVAMGYEDENGLFHHLTKLQEVRTQNLVYADDPDSALLEVGVDTEHGSFVEWMAQRPFYTFDTVRNTTPTADGEWEPLHNFGNESSGTDGGAGRENAGYRVLGDYMYTVRNEGTIYIYMKPANGAIPISNIVEGVPEDSDEEFTYRITARYPGVEEEQAREALPHQEDCYAWPSGDTARNTASNAIAVRFEIETDDDPPAGAQNNLKSVGEITLKANQAVELYAPAGVYTIEEITGGLRYDVEIGDGGRFEPVMKAGELIDPEKPARLAREISSGDVGGFTAPAVFKYTTLNSANANVQPEVAVDIIGSHLNGEDFAFEIASGATEGMEFRGGTEAVNDADGTVRFGYVEFSKEGSYTVTIKQNNTNENSSIKYDEGEITITYEVVKDSGGSAANIERTAGGDTVTFTGGARRRRDLPSARTTPSPVPRP